ncbi:methyltransferase domain-containing protein [Uliginosibacterium sediminicola]|uniref:Methyltransferase domain-containing protein n=1 Tax=Uliginosibacterium sediminicola TaxID=2024550 RepID=A0ABU9YVD4_9RHOO
MNHDLIAFESSIERLIDAGEFDSALAALRALVEAVIHDPAATGSVLRSPTLDAICQRIGAISLDYVRSEKLCPPPAEPQAEVIILATELHNVGGHSRVVEDIIRALPDKRVLILLTDFFCSDYAFGLDRFTALGIEVRRPERGQYVEHLAWTQMQLACHPDAQVMLFNHHADVAAIAAIQPGLNREVLFCHHGDHHLCLGASLNWTRHVDLFAAHCVDCRANGLAAEFWPLSVDDPGARPHDAQHFLANAQLLSCSSGHDAKFLSPYPFHYWDILPQLLKTSGGSHVHIGSLTEDMLAAIHQGLAAEGLAPTRFVHIPWVDNVGETLKQLGVDLYIGSFPIGGSRACIEAMAAGIPIITHRHMLYPILGSDGAVGDSLIWSWSTPEELLSLVAQATPAALAQQAQHGRDCYLRYNASGSFRAAVRGEQRFEPDARHQRPPGDPLASYLLRSQIRQENTAEVFALLDAIGNQDSTSDTSPLARARALIEAGHLAEANEALMQALELAPEDPQILFELGRLAFLGKMPEEGYNILQQTAQAHPAILPAIEQLAQTLLSAGDTQNGRLLLSLLPTATRAQPSTSAEALARGRSLIEAGHLGEANEALMQALELAPEDPQILFELGRLAFLGKMPEEGYNILQQTAQAHPSILPAILQLGQDMVSAGDMESGRLILSLLRDATNAQRPSGTPADGLARIRGLSDAEWLRVLCDSPKFLDYHGFILPGFPDEQFQINTMGSSNEQAMQEAGLFYRAVLPYVNRMRPLATRTLLDFGTGWGRFPRTFVKIFEPHNIHGIDVDQAMVDVCRNSFSFGHFSRCEPFPPTHIENEQFDLITAYSVFSHLSEDAANGWIKEFARILRPGGLVAFTTQGRDFIDQCAYYRQQSTLSHPWHINLAASFTDAEACRAAYDRGEFLFAATGGGDARPSSFYGEALIPLGYMLKHWNAYFDVLSFIDDRNIMPQAFTILRRK